MPRKAKPGEMIGKYRIEKEINAGAMAFSYAATCGDEKVFLKQYKSPTPTVPWYEKYVEYQKELKRRVEATNAKNFSYRFIDFFEAPFAGSPFKNFFQVFEWVEGGKDLEHFLQDCRVPGKVSWEQRRTLACVMMAGINAVHDAGIVHCDLKPPNIVLFEDNDIAAKYRLKVIDMDFSVLKDQAAPWHGTSGYVGTPMYFSPEHLRPGFVPVQSSDIFTCGIILYELLADCHPYPDQESYNDAVLNWTAPAPALLGDIPGDPGARDLAAKLIYQCLCPDAAKRPSAKDVNFALRGRFEGTPPDVTLPTERRPMPPRADPPSRPPSETVPPPPPPPPPLPPPTPKAARLELVSESGKVLACGIRTDLGKHICSPLGEDARFMSDIQCTLSPDEAAGAWILTHNVAAKNQTVVNGAFPSGPVTLKEGDVVGVGNAAKGIVKLPMKVRYMSGG